jgi:hypothetical protein
MRSGSRHARETPRRGRGPAKEYWLIRISDHLRGDTIAVTMADMARKPRRCRQLRQPALCRLIQPGSGRSQLRHYDPESSVGA